MLFQRVLMLLRQCWSIEDGWYDTTTSVRALHLKFNNAEIPNVNLT